MKSIKLLTVAFLSLTLITSCSKGDLGVQVGVGQGGVWVQIGPGQGNGGYYYGNSNNIPSGVYDFVGYVRGRSFDPTNIPLFYQNGGSMNMTCSSTSYSPYFIDWLSQQNANTLVPVLVHMRVAFNQSDRQITYAYW